MIDTFNQRHGVSMKHIITLTIALPFLAMIPACDSPDNEAELQALDVEDDVEAQAAEEDLDIANHTPDPEAATPGQLCRVDSNGPNIILYTSPNSGIWVPPNSLVRILDYADTYHYLARYSSTVGQLERSRVIQSSCYWQ